MDEHLTTDSQISIWLIPRYWPDTDKQLSMMDRLFNRMDGSYPHKWRSAFANAQAITNWREAWAEAFDDERLTAEEVRAGIVTCRKLYDWPPSLPEFLKACRPALDYERAFIEAVEQMRLRDAGEDVWSNPAVFWAARKLGSDMTTYTYSAISKRWAAALDDATAQVRAGMLPSEVPARVVELPAPGQTTVSAEKAAENLARMKSMLAGSRLITNLAPRLPKAVRVERVVSH